MKRVCDVGIWRLFIRRSVRRRTVFTVAGSPRSRLDRRTRHTVIAEARVPDQGEVGRASTPSVRLRMLKEVENMFDVISIVTV